MPVSSRCPIDDQFVPWSTHRRPSSLIRRRRSHSGTTKCRKLRSLARVRDIVSSRWLTVLSLCSNCDVHSRRRISHGVTNVDAADRHEANVAGTVEPGADSANAISISEDRRTPPVRRMDRPAFVRYLVVPVELRRGVHIVRTLVGRRTSRGRSVQEPTQDSSWPRLEYRRTPNSGAPGS